MIHATTLARTGFVTFRPRPDRPEAFDQQHSFCYERVPMAILVGGNGSGTTTAAAFKTALFLLSQQPPPRKDTPFWIVSETYDQVCSVCWLEKLHGMQLIPDSEVDWRRVSWIDRRRIWPRAVPLKPWPGRPGRNWMLEFKSYEQGRRALQGRAIGGFWLSEQFPEDVLVEVLRGCREFMFPGGQFAEFTPVDPELCLWLERVIDEPPPGWKVYRCNTELNTSLADGWLESFKSQLSSEMAATRLTGALPIWEGVIFASFNPAVHVVPEEEVALPPGARHFKGIDWGGSHQHPFACVWGCQDGTGSWLIYDEYWNNRGDLTPLDHVEAVRQIDRRWGWGQDEEATWGEAYADPSRPDLINLWRQEGFPVMPTAGATGSRVLESIETVRSLLNQQVAGRPKILISSRCRHLVEEMRKYRWKPRSERALRTAGDPPLQPLKKDDDTVDALRYMIHSVEKQRGQPPGSADYQHGRPDVHLHRHGRRRESWQRGFFRR